VRLTAPRAVWALIAAGTAVRIALAFTTDGQPYDIEFLRDLRRTLGESPLRVYETLMGPNDDARYPYLPGYFPFAALAGGLASLTGLAYEALVRLPAIFADAALALVVQDFLARRGASDRRRVAATALVALGPSFIVISGYHGQVDSLAILPAVVAVAMWDRWPESRRAIYAGLLIGTGVVLKTTPVVMLLALLPAVRSWREAAKLLAAGAVVPIVVAAPWLVTSFDEMRQALRYRGFPGTSGLSILLQPEFGEQLLRQVSPNAVVDFLYDRGQALVLAVIAGVAAFAARRRPDWGPAQVATMIWLAFYVVTPAFFFQYLVWGIPFFLLAGHLRLALATQAAALIPTVLFYMAPWESNGVAAPYAITMILLWALFAGAFAYFVLGPERRAALAARVAARARWFEWGTLAVLAAYALVPLAAMVRFAVAGDLTFAGADGPFPGDQYQYMTWIREYEDHLLASNTLDIAASDHVFFHPMFFLSGFAVRLGIGVEVAYLIWKPVAIAALFFGFRAYVRRFVSDPWLRVAALGVALFFSVPAIFHYLWNIADSEGNDDSLLNAAGELLPATLIWGYMPAAIAVGLMPVFLLGVERIVAALDTGARPGTRLLVLVSLTGAAASWLHPWQGQVLLVTAAAALVLRRRFDLRQAWVVIPLAVTFAPILYYFLLSRADSAWALAQAANESQGDLPLWVVMVALLPLAVPAALGVRRFGAGFGERMLTIWPVATVLVFLFFSPSFPQHVLEGMSLPLGVLAVAGLAALRRPRALVAAFAVVATLPGAVYMVDWLRDTVRVGGQVRYLEPGEDAALDYLDGERAPGGVLTRVYMGTLVPVATERQSWVGHPSWTRDFEERVAATEALFAGGLSAEDAEALVRDSGAAFVLVDCERAATAVPALRPLAQDERRFGCATVLRVNGP
jgi:hypothetical protein